MSALAWPLSRRGLPSAAAVALLLGVAAGPAAARPASAARTRASFSHLAARPASLAHAGGSFELSFFAHRATRCEVKIAAVRYARRVGCARARRVRLRISLPADTTFTADSYRVTVETLERHAVSKSLTVKVDGYPAPSPLVTAGGFHTCSLAPSGHVDCWGWNAAGQLGIGSTKTVDHPVEVPGLADVTQLAADYESTCALLTTGHVECWGSDVFGQLGNGQVIGSEPTPVPVLGITDATQIAVGASWACALLASGHIDCWGENFRGELGDGNMTSTDVPAEVSGISDANEVAADEGHATCARLATGRVDCWGADEYGQLGDGGSPESDKPVETTGITAARELAPGSISACALLADGHVDCWGSDEYGQLGDGVTSKTDATVPREASVLSTAIQIAGSGDSSCAVLAGGEVRCWGYGGAGELGDGGTADSDLPVTVRELTGASEVSVGEEHACAVHATTRIACWGSDEDGQLGIWQLSKTDYPTPQEVLGPFEL